MEAGVVAPERGVGVDGKHGGDDLGGEKNKDGNVQRGAPEGEFSLPGGFEKPGGGDDSGNEIDKKHFIKLKDFGCFGPENKGGEEKEGVKAVTDSFFKN